MCQTDIQTMRVTTVSKFALAGFIIAVTAWLMWTKTIGSDAGIVIIIGIAGGLGLYEGGKQRGRQRRESP